MFHFEFWLEALKFVVIKKYCYESTVGLDCGLHCRQKILFKIIIGIPTTWHHSSDFTRTPSLLEESISLKIDRAVTRHLDDMIYYDNFFGKIEEAWDDGGAIKRKTDQKKYDRKGWLSV